MKTQRSFTLIELLVVIAIIGILAGVVLVSLQGGTDRANTSKALEASHIIKVSLAGDLEGEWSFNEGTGSFVADGSGNGNTGDWNGTGSHWQTNSVYNTAGIFNGTNDYLLASSFEELNGAGEFTIEFLAKFDTPQGYVLWKEKGFLVEVQATDYRFRFHLDNDWRTPFSIDHKTGIWHHILITWDGTNTTGYYNSVETFTSPGDSAYTAMSSSSNDLYIGRRDANYFKGLIDEVRVYNRALSITEVQQLYAQRTAEHSIALK